MDWFAVAGCGLCWLGGFLCGRGVTAIAAWACGWSPADFEMMTAEINRLQQQVREKIDRGCRRA